MTTVEDMARNEIAAGIPTPPCPPWCQEPAGHPWEEVDLSSTLARSHVARFGLTEVHDVEEFDLETGETEPACEPVIDAGRCDVDSMTPEDAEELAAELLAAAAYYRATVARRRRRRVGHRAN